MLCCTRSAHQCAEALAATKAVGLQHLHGCLTRRRLCRFEQYSIAALAEHLARVAMFSKEVLGSATAWQLHWPGAQVHHTACLASMSVIDSHLLFL